MVTYNNKLVLIFVSSIIMITIISPGCLEENDKITAKTAFDIALNNANQKLDSEKNLTKTRVGQIWGGEVNNNGKAGIWHCSFSIIKNSTHLTYFYYKVAGKDSVELIEEKVRLNSGGNPIKNWTLDSDEAMEVAKDNKKINGYLDEYENAEVDHMQLDMWKDYSKDDAIWKIDWLHSTGLGSPVSARIIINAHTGEVLQAEADS